MPVVARSAIPGYTPVPGRYDELVDAPGRVRPAWQALAPLLGQLSPDELRNHRAEARRLLRADGVTYNVYGAPDGHGRLWPLDPLPSVWTSAEWAVVEAGVAQRARLMAALLDDLYAEQRVLHERLLPAAAVLAHGGFVRPLLDPERRFPGDAVPRAMLAATDLVRDGDGALTVLADRLEAPSGWGYAIQNRAVTSRVVPTLHRTLPVHRLAPFPRAVRAGLARAAPNARPDPRVVVLTPGPYNEAYFEHAFVASHLGYTLARGSDLQVAGGRVRLRSMGGYEPVDVIVRRVDTAWCDPLELRADSQLGVPGLLEAVRNGSVVVANPVGAGVLESPAIWPYLPALCEELLGAPLAIRQPASWWCGDPDARAHVLAHLDELVIKPVTPWRGRRTVVPSALHPVERQALRADIRRWPRGFTGQETVTPGTTPSVTPAGTIEPRGMVLRAFAVHGPDGEVTVMPGGLARVAPSASAPLISNQHGAHSKDVWVLASEPEAVSGFWYRGGPLVVATDPAQALPSRTVENLYWLGRYAERAEGLTRLLRVVLERRLELQGRLTPGGDEALRVLLRSVTVVAGRYPGFVAASDPLADPLPELASLLLDDADDATLRGVSVRLVVAADAVRDQLGRDAWLALDGVVGALDRLDRLDGGGSAFVADALGALVEVLVHLLAFAGLVGESMVRDPGWVALDLGRRVERAQQTVLLLRSGLVPVLSTAAESLTVESVLVAAESIITYRRRYRGHAQIGTVLDLLLLDAENPRSVAFQLDVLAGRLDHLEGGRPLPAEPGRAHTLLARIRHHLAGLDTSALATPDGATGQSEGRPVLGDLLDDLMTELRALADAVEAEHFAHVEVHPLLLHIDEEQ